MGDAINLIDAGITAIIIFRILVRLAYLGFTTYVVGHSTRVREIAYNTCAAGTGGADNSRIWRTATVTAYAIGFLMGLFILAIIEAVI